MLDVTVVRSKWANGTTRDLDRHGNALLNGDKRSMCCMGFACKAAGLKSSEILKIMTASKACSKANRIPSGLSKLVIRLNNFILGTDLENRLVYYNDEQGISPTERENKIKRIGKEADINFTFVD